MLAVRLLVAATLSAAIVGPAFAAEGNGEPFPGPDAVVREDVGTPNYTMGADAPFNYFYVPKPNSMAGYAPAAGSNQDPYPFKATGQMIRTQPMQPPAIVLAPQPNRHG